VTEEVQDEAKGSTHETEGGVGILDPVDESIAMLLAVGLSYGVVADTLEISTKTIQRRMRQDQFRARVIELRRQRLSAVTARLVAMSDTALDVIKEVMGSEDDRLRFKAAETVIRLGRRHHVEEEQETVLLRRMEVIEAALHQSESEAGQ
jgi:hypothetical protein